MHQNPKPEKLFSKLKKIDRSTIEEIVDFQEQRDKCKSLVNTLNLYTNPSIHLEPAFSYDANQSLQRRRNTLNQLKDPNYIPNSKFLDASQVLQLAYLDKIIEECDEDNFRKETQEICNRAAQFVQEEQVRIRNNQSKVDLEARMQEQFEDQIAFDKEFISKDTVEEVKRDQLRLRHKITQVLGTSRFQKGLSENSTVFYKNKRSPASKIFHKAMPEFEGLCK